jgi:hypothetical protein
MDMNGKTDTVASLSMTGGTYKPGAGGALTTTGAATLAGTVDLTGMSTGSNKTAVLTYGSRTGTFGTVSNNPDVNDFWVTYDGTGAGSAYFQHRAYQTITGPSIVGQTATDRAMAGQTLTYNASLNNTAGASSSNLAVGLASTGTLALSGLAATSPAPLNSSTISGTFATGAAGTGKTVIATNSDTNAVVGDTLATSPTLTLNVVSQRTVTADSISLGRQINGVNLSLLTGQTALFHSAQADTAYTHVTVDGQLFNSTADHSLGVTGSGNLGAGGTFASYAVTGEGLTGEGSYSNVTVGYTATALAKRTVTADSISLGRQISGVDLSLLTGQSTTFHTIGANGAYTSIAVNGHNFTGTEDVSLGVAGSGSLGSSGTFAGLAVTKLENSGAGLTGEGSYGNVTVGYTATPLSNRVVTASAVNLGNVLLNGTWSGNSNLTTSGSHGAYTDITVNGTQFNSADSTGTYILTKKLTSYGPAGGSQGLTVGGEGLTGETPVAVNVSYSANVGIATTVATDAFYTGATQLKATLASGANNLADLASKTIAGGNVLGTEAILLAGTGTAGLDVMEQWRQRNQTDIQSLVASDVLDLTTQTGSSNFVLQMSFDPSKITGDLATLAGNGVIHIAWNNGGDWQNAGTHFVSDSSLGWTGDTTLGDYGVDSTHDVAWVVINHNSEFAVVPEPGTLVLLVTAGLGLLAYAWRWRKRAA